MIRNTLKVFNGTMVRITSLEDDDWPLLLLLLFKYELFFSGTLAVTNKQKQRRRRMMNNVETHTQCGNGDIQRRASMWEVCQQKTNLTTKVVVPLSIFQGIVDSCRTSDNVPEIRI